MVLSAGRRHETSPGNLQDLHRGQSHGGDGGDGGDGGILVSPVPV